MLTHQRVITDASAHTSEVRAPRLSVCGEARSVTFKASLAVESRPRRLRCTMLGQGNMRQRRADSWPSPMQNELLDLSGTPY
jgi:hypothetical protein